MNLRSLGFCALALVALLGATGCGSSSKDKSDTSAQRPSRGFQSDVYKEVGIHFGVKTNGNHGQWYTCTGDYAVGNGSCPGTFENQAGTTTPFKSGPGKVEWETHSSSSRTEILIRVKTDKGQQLECAVRGRERAECDTGGGQEGKPAGSEGGPLKINAQAGDRVCPYTTCNPYIDLRGFCRKDQPRCSAN
jgi:hypothetical protein